MYLSKVSLQPQFSRERSQLARVLQNQAYGIHQLLWDLFPGINHRNFLFREELAKGQSNRPALAKNEPVYYVLSSVLPEQNTPLFQVESKAFEPKLQKGDTLSFRLRANPVIARKVEGKKHSVRHDVVMNAQVSLLTELCQSLNLRTGLKKSDLIQQLGNADQSQLAGLLQEQGLPNKLAVALSVIRDRAMAQWLLDRAEDSGFELVLDEQALPRLQASAYRWHSLPEKGRKAGFSSVDYQGLIRIENPKIFLEKLNNGYGRAKAFGCGLMLVKRV